MYTNLCKLPLIGALSVAAILAVSSCKKTDDGPSNISVTSIKSGAKELAGTTTANGVGVTDNIVITFNRAVDTATVTPTSVTLTPTGGTASVAIVSATGSTATINPTGDLMSGTTYTLAIGNTVKARDGGSFTSKSFTFKTAGRPAVTAPKAGNQIAYWAFNNSTNEASGAFTTSYAKNTYGNDRYDSTNSAIKFNGVDDIVEIAMGSKLVNPSMSISFWAKMDTTDVHGMSYFGIGTFNGMQVEVDRKGGWFKQGARFSFANGNSGTEDLFFNGDGKFKDNGGWQGHNFNTNLDASGGLKGVLKNKWAHIIYTYDAATKLRTWYINGVRMMQGDFNLWPTGDDKTTVTGHKVNLSAELNDVFAFGFPKDRASTLNANDDFANFGLPISNHYMGLMDDVRFWNVAITAADVTTLHNAEKK